MTRPGTDRRYDARPAHAAALALFCVLFTCAGTSSPMRAGRVGAVERGMATYYARRLAGHRTANGERYDPSALTAAHPVLPFGAMVQVTRLDDDRESHPPVIVRINDRCAAGKKIIDLSEAAARRLGMLTAGIVRVRIQVVSPGRGT